MDWVLNCWLLRLTSVPWVLFVSWVICHGFTFRMTFAWMMLWFDDYCWFDYVFEYLVVALIAWRVELGVVVFWMFAKLL